MKLSLELSQFNIERLDEELRGAFGDRFLGLTVANGRVTVYFSDEMTLGDTEQVQQLVQAHDPLQLTVTQQEKIALAAKLAEMRAANGEPLNETSFAGETETIRKLTQKVAWLEQEMLALRRVISE